MGGSEPFKDRFFIVFHRQYRPPLRFWFWWKVFIFSHLGTGLEVAGVEKVHVFSQHLTLDSYHHEVSVSQKWKL